MSKAETLRFTGVVKEVLPSTTFRIALDGMDNTSHMIVGHISGKIRKNNITILLGDKVEVEMTPYDLSRGRIVYRFK